jgi:hypothetical protein
MVVAKLKLTLCDAAGTEKSAKVAERPKLIDFARGFVADEFLSFLKQCGNQCK